METQPIIETEDLTKIYNGETAVDHLSFAVDAGEIFGFLGPNGAGKTTTLNCMAGLMVRSSLDNSAAYAALCLTPDAGTAFQYRTAPGARPRARGGGA